MRERYRGVQSETASSQQSLKGQVQQLSTALQSAQQQMVQREAATSGQSRVIDELK